MFLIGTILQVSLLLVNAIAILNEERFLARSMSQALAMSAHAHPNSVGWVSSTRLRTHNANAGYNHPYDQNGYGTEDVGIKARLIDLIGAVRTLMRSQCLLCLPDPSLTVLQSHL
jgi:hypothetical protein